MLTSIHNHTHISDGTGPLEDMIAGAARAGLTDLGISDHYTCMPGGQTNEWSMDLEYVRQYVEDLQEAKRLTKNVNLKVGIEADYFPETADQVRDVLSGLELDYVIGSVHYVHGFPVDEDRRLWDAISVDERDDIWSGYWKLFAQMANSGIFDFAAHPDLPKKFGHRPTRPMKGLISDALDAIRDNAMAIEINTAGWSLSAEEAYPSREILIQANRRGIPLLVNADAHSPAHLIRHFDRAFALAADCGYTHLGSYTERTLSFYPLP